MKFSLCESAGAAAHNGSVTPQMLSVNGIRAKDATERMPWPHWFGTYGGYSRSNWGKGVKWVFLCCCSVLDIFGARLFDRETVPTTPGYLWGRHLLGYPHPAHALLGYRDVSHGGPPYYKDVSQLEAFFLGDEISQYPVAQRWVWSGMGTGQKNSCSIVQEGYDGEGFPGTLSNCYGNPPGYWAPTDLRSNTNPTLYFYYFVTAGIPLYEQFHPWDRGLTARLDDSIMYASEELGLHVKQAGSMTAQCKAVNPSIYSTKLDCPSLKPIIAQRRRLPTSFLKGMTETVGVSGDQVIHVQPNDGELHPLKVDAEQAFKQADDIIVSKLGLTKSEISSPYIGAMIRAKASSSTKPAIIEKLIYRCHFPQAFDGIPVAPEVGDGVAVTVNAKGVSTVDIAWDEFHEADSPAKRVISRSEALAKAASAAKHASSSFDVEQVRLVYYSENANASRRVLSPAWEIQLKDTRRYIVDGFGGKVMAGA